MFTPYAGSLQLACVTGITPGKPAEYECSPEILKVSQPVPADVTRTKWKLMQMLNVS